MVGLCAPLSLMLFCGPAAVAGTITFNDLTESPFITDTTGRAVGSCVNEVCTVVLSPLAGSQGLNLTSPANIFGGVGTAEAGILSDTFQINCCSNPFPTVTLIFSSDPEGGPSLAQIPGPAQTLVETGLLQQVGIVTWNGNGAVLGTDTIYFQSDVESTTMPEPSAKWLALTGFALLGISRQSMKGSPLRRLMGRS